MAHFSRGKRPPLRRRAACALLCCLLLAGSPAAAADAPAVKAADAASVLDSLLDNETPPGFLEEADEPSSGTGDVPSSPSPSPGPEGPVEPEDPEEPEEPEEPEVEVFTVTFQMGKFGVVTRQVEEGLLVEDIPEIPGLPAAEVLGWFDAAGRLAEPGTMPVLGDVTYTARWGRDVEAFLKTDTHDAYINGYSNGTFKPANNVKRSEAAQLFYNLVREPQGGSDTFPDVPANAWYDAAVREMAADGILLGGADGNFNGERYITRAEFVKMAVACDTLEDGVCPFTDVPGDAWYAPYVASAYSKGWINGRPDGTFHPNDPIVRGEAVVILNKMLGRGIDPDIAGKANVKNFYDVFPDSWMYPYIVEASTSHEYERTESGEVWGTYEQDLSTPASGWFTDEGVRYYLDGKTRKFLRGEQTIDGVRYVLDSGTGAAYNGFRSEGIWRRYYVNGVMQNDISELGVVSGPYYIKVYKPSNYLIIYAREYPGGSYNVPVRAMRTSCGYGTPTGTFYTPTRYRWLQMVGSTWAQWCTQIQGNYLFHSVPNWTHDNFNLEVGEYNLLGETRSMGCIRLNCRDAKWIYDNCVLGTQVDISSWETGGPLQKPAGLQIPSWHSWDPTDPTAYWKCQQLGCH